MILEHRQKHIVILICVGIIAATFVAYEPMRHDDFVIYDDPEYVKDNPNIKNGITWNSVVWAFTKSHSGNWHPITWLTHILDHQFFGVNPLGHHVISLLFHITNALLLFWLLSYVTGTVWISAFIAAVFALHPIQVESVAWVSERKTVVSGLFWLLTMAAYVGYTRRPGTGRYVMLFLIYGLAIMTKPVVVTLPFVLLLMDYWPLERLKYGRRDNSKTVPLKRLLIEKVPLFVLSAILCVITYITQSGDKTVVTLKMTPVDQRIANMFLSYISYIGKVLWPDRLAVIYPFRQVSFSDGAVILCALMFVIITIISIYMGRRRKYILAGWLWFVGTLVPMIGLVQVGSQAMADRYMYLSITGLLIIIAWAFKDIVIDRPRLRVFAGVLSLVVLFVLVILTRVQVGYWQNSLTLFEHTLKVTTKNEVAEFAYGNALVEAGRADEGVPHLINSVRLCPSFPKARTCLGKVYIKQGKFNEAIVCFNELVRRKQDSADTYEDLGTAYVQLGKYEQAINSWNKAVEMKSDKAKVLNNLAWLLATADDVNSQNAERAVKFAERSCELDSYKKPEFMDTLAAAYAAAGRFDDAVKMATRAFDAAKADGQQDTANDIQKHIELYQAGKRYHQSQKTDDGR